MNYEVTSSIVARLMASYLCAVKAAKEVEHGALHSADDNDDSSMVLMLPHARGQNMVSCSAPPSTPRRRPPGNLDMLPTLETPTTTRLAFARR
jgi:hypothetical protein